MPEIPPRDETGKFTRPDGTNKANNPMEQAAAGAGEKAKEPKKEPQDLSGIRSFVARNLEVPEKELDVEAGKKPEDKKPDDQTPPPKKKPAAAAPPPPPKPVTREDVEDVVQTALGKGKEAPAAGAKKADAAPPDLTKDLSQSDRRQLAVLAHMAKTNPEKYKDIDQKFLQGKNAFKAYVADWEKKNPGQEFDKDDSEHEEFFAKNDVDWNDDDFEEARERLIEERAEQRVHEKLAPKLTALERSEKIRKSAPVIQAERDAAAKKFWEESGDDFKDLLDANGQPNAEKLKALQEHDPELFQVRLGHAEAAEAEAAEIYKLMNGLTDFIEKPPVSSQYASAQEFRNAVDTFRMHQELSSFMADREQKLMAKPEEERQNAEGDMFLPLDQYNRLPEAQRKGYWTFSARDAAVMRSRWRARQAKAIVEAEEKRFQERAKRRNLIKTEETPPVRSKEETKSNKADDDDDSLEEIDGKPNSPESTTTTKMAASGNKGKDSPKTGTEAFLLRALE